MRWRRLKRHRQKAKPCPNTFPMLCMQAGAVRAKRSSERRAPVRAASQAMATMTTTTATMMPRLLVVQWERERWQAAPQAPQQAQALERWIIAVCCSAHRHLQHQRAAQHSAANTCLAGTCLTSIQTPTWHHLPRRAKRSGTRPARGVGQRAASADRGAVRRSHRCEEAERRVRPLRPHPHPHLLHRMAVAPRCQPVVVVLVVMSRGMDNVVWGSPTLNLWGRIQRRSRGAVKRPLLTAPVSICPSQTHTQT